MYSMLLILIWFGVQIQARDVARVATDSNAPPGDQRKTFSKRKVVSNWEKYDEGMCTIMAYAIKYVI